MDSRYDPLRLEITEHRFAGLAEEMGEALVRSSMSPNIKERRDLSCAIFDGKGRLVAHAAHIPVHLGAMPESVASALSYCPPGRGDVVVLNDPYRGGTHLPDITLVAPVHLAGDDEAPSFYVANRAHHADVGGMSSGSMPNSEVIYQEGIIIPPVRLVRAGRIVRDVRELILANVRNPAERAWDLEAQAAVLEITAGRLRELATEMGEEALRAAAQDLIRYSEAMMRAAIRDIPDGVGEASDVLEPVDGEVPVIRVTVTVAGEEARIDFGGTSAAVRGPLNAVRAVTLSAVCYVFRCLLRESAPANAGIMRPLELVTERGSLVDAVAPAAVVAGNVETSQRIVDAVFRALAALIPDRIPAASSGTMMNVALGTRSTDGGEITYYETVAGGAGAAPWCDGAAAIHTHMTNTMNTPAEAIAHELPFRVTRYRLRAGSGGAGRYHGGDGLERIVEVGCPSTASVLSERVTTGPYGLEGGMPGAPSSVSVRRADGSLEELGPRTSTRLAAGDALWIRTPGGGGYGSPPGQGSRRGPAPSPDTNEEVEDERTAAT